VTGNLTLYAKWTENALVNPFKGVKESDWFYNAVMYVYQHGLMNGTASDTFSPNTPITRGMIVTVLWRLAGSPATGSGNPFSDVPGGQYYSGAELWAAANGIVTGYGGGQFGPNDNVTREQLAAMLYRYIVSIGEGPHGAWMTNPGFGDAGDISDWASEAVAFLYMIGVINGKDDNLFDPSSGATRAEFAAMLYRWLTA
jgi:hypothetical protein